jgi:DNA-binding NtrC family response regulator
MLWFLVALILGSLGFAASTMIHYKEILGDLQPRLRNLQDRGVVSLLELKADYPDLKLIAISGESEVALATAKEFGAKRAIAKPFSPADLLKSGGRGAGRVTQVRCSRNGNGRLVSDGALFLFPCPFIQCEA